MKKVFYLASAAMAFLSLFSCQKEVNSHDAENLVTVSFSAEKVGDTKTAAVEGQSSASYIWTNEDIANIKLFTVSTSTDPDTNVETTTLTEVSDPVVTKVSDTKLTIAASVEGNATYTFRAVLCDPASYTGSGDNYSTRKPKSKASQTPDDNSNYDPTADILIS